MLHVCCVCSPLPDCSLPEISTGQTARKLPTLPGTTTGLTLITTYRHVLSTVCHLLIIINNDNLLKLCIPSISCHNSKLVWDWPNVWEGNNSEKFTQTSEYWQDTKILLEMILNQNIWIPYHHHRSDYLRKKHPSGWGIWHKAMQTDMVEQARFGLRKTGDSGDSRAFLHLIFTFLNTSLEPLQSIEIPNYRESEGLKWLRCRENHF